MRAIRVKPYRKRAEEALGLVSDFVTMYPTAFAQWLSGADFANQHIKQIAIVGDLNSPETQALLKEVRSEYRPDTVVAVAPYPIPPGAPALLKYRQQKNDLSTVFICEGFVCQLPVNTTKELRKQLNS